MSDRYIMALYTYCLSARKAAALGNIELEGLSGSGAFYGKIRECPGSVIPGIVA